MSEMNLSVALPTYGFEFPDATFFGPPMDDTELAEAIPLSISTVLVDVNGFIAFDGAFHFRGICSEPRWHSLGQMWKSNRSLRQLFPAVIGSDVPFAQDALGNQFVLRGELVWQLDAETGQLESLKIDVHDFLGMLISSPADVLPLSFLEQFKGGNVALEPGQLLSVYPPLCTAESSRGVSVRAIPANQRLEFLSDFAAQVAGLPDGSRVRVVVDTNDSG